MLRDLFTDIVKGPEHEATEQHAQYDNLIYSLDTLVAPTARLCDADRDVIFEWSDFVRTSAWARCRFAG